MLELATKPLLRVSLIASLFEALHENDILYCHWKSNEHLGASMMGNTDLDVLFDETQKRKLELILHRLGFKRFDSIKQKQYSGIVDFIGFDVEAGKVIHLHTHYRLTMGEPYLKGYQLNIEDQVLKGRVYNPEFGLYCIQPGLELILLFVRESLKLRHRDRLLINLGKKGQAREYILLEYDWLKSRTTHAEIHGILKAIFTDYASIYKIVTGPFNTRQLQNLSPIVKKELKVKRLYSPLKAMVLRWYREATLIFSRKLGWILDQPILLKRINPRGGIVVAVIGADGSGKSTITENLKNTFLEKLDIYKIYFGRGDGKSSWGRKLLKSSKILFTATKDRNPANLIKDVTPKKGGFVRGLYKCMEAFLVAQEKRRNMRVMQNAKRKGALVICDRYPQNQVMGYNDGPLLHDFLDSKNPLFRTVAKMEASIYEEAENHPPDILFKLVTDAEVVEKRKPGETSIEKLNAKINGVKQLKFKDTCKVITVDAKKPLDEVLCIVRKEIWNML